MELLSILRSNAPLRELFGDLFGGAPRLAQVVADRPHVLDAAIDPGRVAAIGESLDEARDGGAGRGLSRRRRRASRIRSIAPATSPPRKRSSSACGCCRARSIPSAPDAPIARSRKALLEALLKRVGDDFARDYGRVKGGRVAVLAMGKFGSREMTAASDLDLIVIYDFPEKQPSRAARGRSRPRSITRA